MRTLGFLVLITILMPADPPSRNTSAGGHPYDQYSQRNLGASAYDPYGGNGASGGFGTHAPSGARSGFCARFPQLCLSPGEAADLAARKLSYGARLLGSFITPQYSGVTAAPLPQVTGSLPAINPAGHSGVSTGCM